eukprot:3219746-Karenia_brevis.AAC.1
MAGAVELITDCQSVQRDCSRGPKWASASGRLYARAWSVVSASIDSGEAPWVVVWMPAHTAAHDEGVLYKSDGSLLTSDDRRANAKAD